MAIVEFGTGCDVGEFEIYEGALLYQQKGINHKNTKRFDNGIVLLLIYSSYST